MESYAFLLLTLMNLQLDFSFAKEFFSETFFTLPEGTANPPEWISLVKFSVEYICRGLNAKKKKFLCFGILLMQNHPNS